MSDNPNKLKAILLENADTEAQVAFAKMLAQECATFELQKTHRCWTMIPTEKEMKSMAKYNESPNYDKCPKCKDGRVGLQYYRGSLGVSTSIVCKPWGNGCGFKEDITDIDNI